MSRLRLSVLACALAGALLAACGSSSPATSGSLDSGLPPATTDAGTVPADGGAATDGGGDTGATDGGTATDGGSGTGGMDGGTGSDGGSGTGGADGGTTADGGTGTDGGTMIDGGTATDGGTGAGGTDGGTSTDGGTAANECDGLLPAAPGAPVSYAVVAAPSFESSYCIAADTDGLGFAALRTGNSGEIHVSDLTFVDLRTNTKSGSTRTGSSDFVGQGSGFIEWGFIGAGQFFDLAKLEDDGTASSRGSGGTTGGGVAANDPLGGLVSYRVTSAGPVLEAWDANASLRWTRQPNSTGTAAVVGVDRVGNILALTFGAADGSGTQLLGQWFSHDGVPGPVFSAGSTTGWPHDGAGKLFERVGSGLFLSVSRGASGGVPGEAIWLAEFLPGENGALPPPAWLQARPGTTLHMVHGGQGYGMLPIPGAAAACAQSIEVLAPSGASCGRATFEIAPGACQTNPIGIGYDGTVLQQLPASMERCADGTTGCTCTWRHWQSHFR